MVLSAFSSTTRATSLVLATRREEVRLAREPARLERLEVLEVLEGSKFADEHNLQNLLVLRQNPLEEMQLRDCLPLLKSILLSSDKND